MRLLHRQLFKEILLLFCLCLGSLLSLLVIGKFLQLRNLLMGLDLNFLDLALLFFYMSPFFLLILIPVACMLSVFMTLLRMSTDRELTALRSSGVSLYQLLPAPILFCILCTCATLYVSMFGLSWGIDHFRGSVVEYARTRTQLVMKPGVFNQQFPGLMVYAKKVDNRVGLLEEIIVEDRTNEPITATILAPTGRIVTVPEKGRILVALENGRVYRQDENSISVLSFDKYLVRLDLTRLLKGFDLFDLYDAQPRELSYKQLKALEADPSLISKYNYDEDDMHKVYVEIQKRLALPVACLVLGLAAIPLACAFEGLARHWGLILALGFFLIYYSLLSFGISLGTSGVINPRVAMWTPNIVLFILGVLGLRQAALERTPLIFERLRHWRSKSSKEEQPA